MFEHVNERLGQLLTIRDAQVMLGKLLSILSDHNENASLIQHIKQSMQELFDHVVHLRSSFEDLPYPFDHARPDISMADYLLKELPDSQNPVALYEAADTIGHALPSLQARVTGRLCQRAECVETFFGLNLLDDPPARAIGGDGVLRGVDAISLRDSLRHRGVGLRLGCCRRRGLRPGREACRISFRSRAWLSC